MIAWRTIDSLIRRFKIQLIKFTSSAEQCIHSKLAVILSRISNKHIIVSINGVQVVKQYLKTFLLALLVIKPISLKFVSAD
jgi:hypothetical protein